MFSIHLKSKALLAAVCSLSWLGALGPAQAVPSRTAGQLLALDSQNFSFIPPEDSGQPRTNRAGGRRDQVCNNASHAPSLTLFLPPTNHGMTTAAHPTFLAYLPQTSAQQAFLKLEDEDDNYLYHSLFEIPTGAGIVSFSIPDTAPALEPDKYYKVSLAMICGQALDPNDPVVEGWIKRIELNTVAAPQPFQGTSLELGAWYASNGVWFDALNQMADVRRAEPDNLDAIAAWETLLQSVDLEALGTATFLGHVN